MLFSKVAEYFERIEATTKRLEMLKLLAELFREANKDEIAPLVYFCQENIAPPFAGLELGIAEKMAEKAIAHAYGIKQAEVEKLYKELGDLGSVAEKLRAKRKIVTLLAMKPLELREVYNTFMKIAKTSGEGSVDRKILLLSGLLTRGNAKEVRYIVRFALGRLRLGVGDPTILDALAVAKLGSKEYRPTLERAYNLCSDLGLVAKVLWEEGLEGIKKFKVKPGNPIRMALAERLESAEEIIKKIGRCAAEHKYDGFRMQIHKWDNKVEIFSRNLERLTHMFPEIVEATLKLKCKEIIFEGEAIGINESTGEFYPFQVTITRRRKYGIEEKKEEIPLYLFAFDLLYLDGEDYTQKPYVERRRMLEKIIKESKVPRIELAEKIETDDAKELRRFFEAAVERGLEGIVAKRLDAPYSAGARNFNWIKLKRSYKGELADTIDVVIVGYFKGRGHRAKFGIGAVLVAVYDPESDTFKTIAKVGSGFSEEEWMKLKEMLDAIKVPHKPARVDSFIEPDVWVEPKYVITVMADEITRSPLHTCGWDGEAGYALRFPRAQGFIRSDKTPEDANTVKEILEMYKMQKHVSIT